MNQHPLRSLFLTLAVAIAVALMAWASVAPGATSTALASAATPFAAQADAWINEGQPDTNYGSSRELRVGRIFAAVRPDYNQATLVYFDVSSIPAGSTITSAKLELYQTGADGPKSYAIAPYPVTSSWTESKVTWNNHPSVSSSGGPASWLDTANGWKSWDVKAIVQNWVNGEIRNYGLLLRGDGDTIGLRVFYSRETGGEGPRLTVEYAVPRPSATPTATRKPVSTPTATRRPTTTPSATPVGEGRIAYIFNRDGTTAASFQTFLQSHGWSVVTFPISQLAGVDLSPYEAIIVGYDSGSDATWGNTQAVEAVTTSKRPVLGIYQGGYAFFGKLGLNIGYPNAATGGTYTTVYAINPSHPAWTTPFSIALDASDRATIYGSAQAIVGIHDSHTDASNELIGDEGAGREFNFLLGEKRCYMLWGYRGDPTAMTIDGQHLFVNALTHLVDSANCPEPGPTSTPTRTYTPTPSRTPTRTPTRTSTPTRTPTPSTDLIADKLEVTQGVQDLNNSVRLVANKRTYVRFHVHSTSGYHPTTAWLFATKGSSTVWLFPINSVTVRPSPDRGVLNHSFLFELPDGYKSGTVSLTAYLNPVLFWWTTHDPLEWSYANNSATATVSFESVSPMNLVIYRVGYRISGTTYYPSSSDRNQLIDWLRRAYPISTLNTWKRITYYGTGSVNSTGGLTHPSCGDVNSILAVKKLVDLLAALFTSEDGPPSGAHYYGMVDDGGGFMRGCAADIPTYYAAGPTGSSTWGWDFDGSYGDWYGGHELGHTYGRYHAMFCGAGGGVAYPYPSGRISPSTSGNNALYGFDISTHDIYPPTWKDLMTYCDNEWLSDFTYEGLMTYFQTHATAASVDRLLLDQVDRLLVSGTIDPVTDAVSLNPMMVIPDAGDVQERVPGDYAIVLRNAGNAELARYPFTPVELIDGPSPPDSEAEPSLLSITELVPYVEGTVKVEIEKLGTVLIQVTAGATPPNVNLTYPNGGENLTQDPINVTWTASDSDGDPLYYALQYSRDNGSSWELLAQNLTEKNVQLEASMVGSTAQGRFRVWATDGIHTTTDESDGSFTVPNRVPVVDILEPSAAVTVLISQTVTLRGDAYDPDMGSMEEAQLQWLSNLDGLLGNGDMVSTATLSVGTHTITFQADDGDGGVGTDTVQVTVVGNPSELPPAPDALIVGPSLVSFDIGGAQTSAQIWIENQNASNSIRWNATPSESWVQLSATSGVTPAEITASFNDTGLAPGIYTASITITSPDLPGETETISVEAVVPGGYTLNLPLVLRQ